MKNKIKKIAATTLLSITTIATIGCGSPNTKIAKKINNGLNNFVSSINKLDYVETNKTDNSIGKIALASTESKFLSNAISTANIENTITRPSERTDNFKLYILSETPYISFSSDDNYLSLSMQFSTDKIENTSYDISEKINKLILKRAILMIYVNEIYNGNISLSEENRTAINAYVNVIKENASFLNGNRGMVRNQLNMANNLLSNQSNDDIVNYYIIKSGEALEIRSNKIDSTISAIDSIIQILEQNLSSNSCYYNNNLSNTYDSIISKTQNSSSDENSILAKNIAESIDFISSNITTNNQLSNNDNTTNNLNQYTENQNNTVQSTDTTNQNNTTQSTDNTNQNNYLNNNVPQTKIANLQNNTPNTNEISNSIQRNSTNKNKQSIQNNEQATSLTPSQTAKKRRHRNNNSMPNRPINPSTNDNQIHQTPHEINNQTHQNNETQTTSTKSNELNRATRVPYTATSTNFTD